jgi:integrase
MERINLRPGRVAGLTCIPGKSQTLFWDAQTPWLGVRVTAAGSKSYIFETRLRAQTLRITIGDVRAWTVDLARAEANRLKTMTDQGIDPRQVRTDNLAAEKLKHDANRAQEEANRLRALLEAVTVRTAWDEYVTERKPQWSAHHLRDHEHIIQAGGTPRRRSPKLTEPGPLAPLAGMRLIDLTTECIESWARVEAAKRPTQARLALRLLKAFLFWCAAHPIYTAVSKPTVAQSKKARECLGKAKTKNDVLQREQLRAWFAAVRQIGNPVISAYLQCLLLLGPRREELAKLQWGDIDFQWNSVRLADKINDFRMVPLTPYVAYLLAGLPKRNKWVFSSPTAASGRLMEPSIAHRKACAIAGLDVSLHGLRRSFATLSEWVETPAGIAAQIQGHAPQGVREQNYIRRPLDLLRMWHIKIEAWILEQAGIEFIPAQAGLKVVAAA